MSFFEKIRGTIETIFQLGLAGPQLKNNSSVIEARNSGDSGYVVLRGATPVNDNDLATKQYVDTLARPFVVTAQQSGASALPSNTSTEHFIVVTTTGGTANIGDLIWDDGTNTGTAALLSAAEGRTIFTSQAFSGGTISLRANAFYVWDTSSSSWLLESSAGIAGALRVIRYTVNNSATQDSSTQIPANSYVLRTRLEVTTPYSGGATVSIGQSGSTALLMGTGDNTATVANTYEVPQDTSWGGSALAVRTTVGGSPAAGAGVVIVEYVVPDA